MNTGQSLFSIGALLLLSLSVLRVNNNILVTDTVLQDSKLGILATSLATSLIEEAKKKSFDLATYDEPVYDVSSLTAPSGLGPSDSETDPSLYNDFDDYNGLEKEITNMPSAIFHLSCEVCYVQDYNVDHKVMTRTWHKKMTVTVSSPSMADTIKISNIYSYWYFR